MRAEIRVSPLSGLSGPTRIVFPPLPLHFVQGKRGGLSCGVPPGLSETQNQFTAPDLIPWGSKSPARHSPAKAGRRYHTLRRSAGFGNAGVPPANFAVPPLRKTAGETPAPPNRPQNSYRPCAELSTGTTCNVSPSMRVTRTCEPAGIASRETARHSSPCNRTMP
jgi:hypothetical protein